MRKNIIGKALAIIGLCCMSLFASAQTVKEPASLSPGWMRTYQPFRIVGNLYYVGTYDLACYLIVTPKGNILINTGLAASTPIIKSNIEALGFKLSDTKILLTTQAHYDHVGAMAEIKKLTGAKMMVDAADAGVMEDGGRSDYEYGGPTSAFAPVKVDAALKDGEKIKLGGTEITILHHPGHTKGSSSFVLNVKDDTKTWKVLIANMPTIVTDKPFSAVPGYPKISADYAYTLASLKAQQFDLWLSSHASQMDMHKKRKPGDAYNPSVFADRAGYDALVAGYEKDYKEKIK
ncbi:subclass B3 metallo-beta-lactamase [Mucilaginibacter auburnensis]|uniref:Metallo-beta-lactamase class B n=1 Tax=Mucilaginibacter auburnensis TaxID=1457233 RepID=A0A2H9VQK5_9SPHI|nr:subclass B3 metallo-beta-lactamase [Mucilaginibacter auburnensis]PJJ83112.1 metallo-beta-lactamase class B [Mucilaginibacter auburnensis]